MSCEDFIGWIQEQERKKKEKERQKALRKVERDGKPRESRIRVCDTHTHISNMHTNHSEARALVMRNAEVLWGQILQVGWLSHAYTHTHGQIA